MFVFGCPGYRKPTFHEIILAKISRHLTATFIKLTLAIKSSNALPFNQKNLITVAPFNCVIILCKIYNKFDNVTPGRGGLPYEEYTRKKSEKGMSVFSQKFRKEISDRVSHFDGTNDKPKEE